jgi:ribosomal protein L14
LTSGSSITLTLIVDGNATAIYGDACKVEGTTITGGIQWSGGSPPANTSNTDILTFVIVRDTSGVTRVYGQGNTGFS